jgi:cytochrome c-type biogenesis protein
VNEFPFALAFTAGLVATVNPCGFAMLPAYLAFLVGGNDTPGRADPADHGVGRALRVGILVSAGFLTVFGVAGALLVLGVRAVVGALPWAAMAVGVGVTGLGITMLGGYRLRWTVPGIGTKARGPAATVWGAYSFGVAYAVASLSCTLPIFLAVVAGTIPQLGPLPAVATFLIYGLGTSLVLVVATVAVGIGRTRLLGRLRRSGEHVGRASGVILVVVGVYVVGFWIATLATGGVTDSAVIRTVESWSSRATDLLGASATTIGSLLAGVVAISITTATIDARRRRPTDPDRTST